MINKKKKYVCTQKRSAFTSMKICHFPLFYFVLIKKCICHKIYTWSWEYCIIYTFLPFAREIVFNIIDKLIVPCL